MSELKLFNTLTRKEETFKPVKAGEVRMYVCGPTVNDVPHLGHARQQITFDVLAKYLKFIGYKVKFVSNITDIDDKIINKANELKEDIKSLTERNFKAHVEDYTQIGVNPPDVRPRATEYVEQMIQLVKTLEEKGFTYIIDGDGVYYDISKFPEYGKLSHQNVEDLKTGARIKIKEQKRNKEDFVLWKFSKPGEPSWDSPWGEGRPGWHIECSAMSHSILGLPLDIHGGGHDLIFPHHEDEIAQSEAAYDEEMANFWIHNGMVNVDKVKMSKSLGNFTTIRDLLKKYSGNVIRYFVLSTHYRKPQDFALKNLDAAKSAMERLERKVVELRQQPVAGKDKTQEYTQEFTVAMDSDLNTPAAVQVMWKALDDSEFDSQKKIVLLEKLDEVFSLGIKNMQEKEVEIPSEVQELLEQRESFRKQKKWADADAARDKLKQLGYIIEDTPQGPRVVKSA